MGQEIWFYASGEHQNGPVSGEQLLALRQNGRIGDDTLIWRDGMNDWQVYSALAHEFGGDIETGIEAAPVAAALPPPTAIEAGTSPYSAPQSFFDDSAAPAPQPARFTSTFGLYTDPSVRAKVLSAFFIACVVVNVALIVSCILQYNLLNDLNDGVYEGRDDEYDTAATANDYRHGLIGVGSIGIFLGCVVSWCMWKYRAAVNAQAFGASWMTITPGWAVGWYFVPIAMIWMPCKAMSQIWRATVDPKRGEFSSTGALVGWWWALYLISNIADNITARLGLDTEDVDGLIASTVGEGIGGGVELLSAIVAIALVKRLTKMQVERYETSLAEG